MSWSLLPTISAPMPLQMVLDELLFEFQKKEEAQAPTLRFYVSSEPWVSAGCSFRDSAALSKSGLILKNPQVPVCRRITGGGCVLHGPDLIFSLIARYDRSLSPLSSVSTSYGKIHEGVKMGLEFCGLDSKFYGPGDAMPQGSDCFDSPVESDLSWKGKKIAGGAQKRSGGVLLHHESILIPPGVERADLIRAIRQGMETVFEMTVRDTDLDPEIFFDTERKAMSREPWALRESFSSRPSPQASRP
jgi:lipoate-protein ligase A